MKTFLEEVVADLGSVKNHVIILPSKRAGLFFKKALTNQLTEAIISPKIISIEEFIEEVSGLITITNTEILFGFYDIYLKNTPEKEIESFETFSKWAQIIIQDFNEIDRYKVNQASIFNYLKSIKELEHWSLLEPKTEQIENYLKFWNNLEIYYNQLSKLLLKQRKAYQGLAYRKAAENIDLYLSKTDKTLTFIGFNALNTCEEIIFKAAKLSQKGKVFWDIDAHFYNEKYHAAGQFIRRHKKRGLISETEQQNFKSNYNSPKNISVIGTQKSVAQAKVIGQLLSELDSKTIEKTALVLADENLLLPVLNSLPDNITNTNITMGLPLQLSPINYLFEKLFEIHKTENESIYFKDVLIISQNEFIKPLFQLENIDQRFQKLKTTNKTRYTLKELKAVFKTETPLLNVLFNSSKDNIIKNILSIIDLIKTNLNTKEHQQLNLEYLYKFASVFTQLEQLNTKHKHIKSVNTLYQLYKELLATETLDLQGEPLQGLQIMGMLESRVLDYETVIISSVNEGILPAGKSNNSFIPYDLKIEYGLPTYKDKDAIYTYHFYHLLQRSKNSTIIYNTEMDALLGGEKSRFINQLETENIHNLQTSIISSHIPTYQEKLEEIVKTKPVQLLIKQLVQRGFSPSSLTNYVRNPIDFYNEKILRIKNTEAIEETIEANTLGTIVHEVLELFYTPFINTILAEKKLKLLKPKIEVAVKKCFTKFFKEGDITQGKNLIIFEVAKRYVANFIDYEIAEVKKGHQIKIIALEAKESITFSYPELDFPITINGTVDRIDKINGQTRIIDYKTGKVTQDKVRVTDWEKMTQDYDKGSKPFQILTYAYMLHNSKKVDLPITAGIISFKNLKEGFIPFQKQISRGKYNSEIDDTILEDYKTELKQLVLEICNPKIPFTEKELPDFNF